MIVILPERAQASQAVIFSIHLSLNVSGMLLIVSIYPPLMSYLSHGILSKFVCCLYLTVI